MYFESEIDYANRLVAGHRSTLDNFDCRQFEFASDAK